MGSVVPTETNAAREIIRYAIASAMRDPRFDPVDLDEVPELTVIGAATRSARSRSHRWTSSIQPCTALLLAPAIGRGCYCPVSKASKRRTEQLAAVCQKAGINRLGPLTLERFRTRSLT